MVKNLPAMQDTWVRPLDREDPLEKGNGNPLQYSCLENPMDREAWQATVHGVAKSWTQLSNFTSLHFTSFHFTVDYSLQASPSMGFSKQEYQSGLPFLPPGDLPNPGIKPRSPALQADTLTSEPPGKPAARVREHKISGQSRRPPWHRNFLIFQWPCHSPLPSIKYDHIFPSFFYFFYNIEMKPSTEVIWESKNGMWPVLELQHDHWVSLATEQSS